MKNLIVSFLVAASKLEEGGGLRTAASAALGDINTRSHRPAELLRRAQRFHLSFVRCLRGAARHAEGTEIREDFLWAARYYDFLAGCLVAYVAEL